MEAVLKVRLGDDVRRGVTAAAGFKQIPAKFYESVPGVMQRESMRAGSH
jgi:hypothetical protein